jgi:hypothetical protein
MSIMISRNHQRVMSVTMPWQAFIRATLPQAFAQPNAVLPLERRYQ